MTLTLNDGDKITLLSGISGTVVDYDKTMVWFRHGSQIMCAPRGLIMMINDHKVSLESQDKTLVI